MKTLFNINKTYPGVKSRRLKKRLKRCIPCLTRNGNRPKRGDVVFTASGHRGRFVGLDPTGKVWVALDKYREQFPYKLQCETFDNAWRKPIWNQ